MRSVASAFGGATIVVVAEESSSSSPLSKVEAKTSTNFLENLEASSKKPAASNLAIINWVLLLLAAFRFCRFAVKADVVDTEMATNAAENFMVVSSGF